MTASKSGKPNNTGSAYCDTLARVFHARLHRSFWPFLLRRFGAPEAHKITGLFGRVTIAIRHPKVNRRAAPASAAYDAPRANGQKGIIEKKDCLRLPDQFVRRGCT